jgi:hypothetical protein
MKKVLEAAVAFILMMALMGMFIYAVITPDPYKVEQNRQWAAEAAQRDAADAKERFRECLHRELARWGHEPTDEQYLMAEARCEEEWE